MYTYMLTYMSIHDAYMYIYFTYMSHICAFRMGIAVVSVNTDLFTVSN